MKILITGGHGFVGNNLYEHLKHSDDVFRLECDLTDANAVLTQVEMVKPDFIIHCGAIVSSLLCDIAKDYAIDVNVRGSYNIAIASKRVNANLLYIGSTASYLPSAETITEETPSKPQTLYGMTKLLGEMISMFVLGENLLILRFCFAHGGINDWHSGIANMIRSFKEKRPCILQMSPENYKDYMHILDFCNAVKLAIDKNLKGFYNVSHGEPTKLKDIVELLRTLNITPTIIYRPEDDYLGNHVVSSKKFRDATGWFPKMALKAGIENVLANWEKEGK